APWIVAAVLVGRADQTRRHANEICTRILFRSPIADRQVTDRHTLLRTRGPDGRARHTRARTSEERDEEDDERCSKIRRNHLATLYAACERPAQPTSRTSLVARPAIVRAWSSSVTAVTASGRAR